MTRTVWLALLGNLIAAPALATTFTVTSAADGAGTCPSANSCTLRQAITDANTAGGSNQINFSIPGSGVHTITLTSQLPGISNNLLLNGSTQSGAVLNTNAPDQGGLNTKLMIQIDGAGQTYGFYVSGNYTVAIEHLAMNGFNGVPISGDPSHTTSSLTVRGCFIGAQLDGTAFPSGYGNSGVAIRTYASQAQIGGALPGERNLLSGNRGGGIYIDKSAIIEGNLIGTDAGATVAIGNGPSSNWPGIVLPGNFANIRIGCTASGCSTAASRNIISGNHTYGIGIWDTYSQGTGGLEIKGNFIGTDWTGTQPLPNGDATAGCPNYCGGIQLQGSPTVATPASIIGGFAPGEANLIAFNNGPGIVAAFDRIGESFDSRANEIHNNRGGADIDIGAPGPTANDAGDADTGANLGQNSPVIVSASVVGSQLHVTYHVDSTTTNSAYPLRIDFYANVHGGSGDYIGQDIYAAGDAQLDKSISLPLPLGVKGIPFVATATDANGYTSEFTGAYDVIFEDGFD